jgi:2'-5' RNA ligase
MAAEAGKPAREDLHRVFFALWPDAACGGQLAALALDLQRRCGGRALQGANLHMTLAFLGNANGAGIERLRGIAAGIGECDFELELDRLQWLRRRRIVWTECSHTPEPLQRLAGALEERLRAAAFALEARAFAAHVTLLRNAHCEADLPSPPAIRWRADAFVLVESRLARTGASYHIIGRWPLRVT